MYAIKEISRLTQLETTKQYQKGVHQLFIMEKVSCYMNLKESSSSLKRIGLYSWFLKIIPIPISIIISKTMSNIITCATAGKTKSVLNSGILLITIVVISKIFHFFTTVAFQKSKSIALHNCKLRLYQIFLENPLNVLFSSDHGQSIEKLNDDFNTVTGKSISLFPNFFTSILTVIVYSIFLSLQNIYVSWILLAISLLQVLPPIIIKKYMQVNYDKTRDIEAQITNFTIEGYRGFATIKLYQLKQWWLDRLTEYHKKYIKIGNIGIYTSTAESALNQFVSTILKYGTCTILGLLVLSKIITVEVGIQAIALSDGLFTAVKTIFSTIPRFAVAKIAEKRLSEWFFEIDQTTPLIKDKNIDLKNVTKVFNEKEILK